MSKWNYILICSIINLSQITIHSQDTVNIIDSVKSLILADKANEAIDLLNDTLAVYPFNDTLITMLGVINLDNKQFETAEELLKKAVSINRKNNEAKYSLAEAYTISSQYEKAKKIFKELLEKFPDKGVILNYLGQIAIAESNYPEVKNHFNELLKIDSTNSDILSTLGIIALNDGDYDKAEQYLNRSTNYDNNKPDNYYNLGIICLLKGKYKQSLDHLMKAAELDASNVNILYTTGLVYLILSQNNEAQNYFKKILMADSRAVDALVGLYITNRRNGNSDNALKTLELLEKISPGYKHINLLKADYYYSLKQVDKAIYFTQRDLRENEELPEVFAALGELYLIKGEKEKADINFKKAQQVNSNHADNEISLTGFLEITSKLKTIGYND